MSSGYVIPMDPTQISSRFHTPDLTEPEDDDDSDPELTFGVSYEERLVHLLDRIPQREADIIFLYFVEKKRQADIAAIFNVTQAAISYRLVRGLERIKFLLSIPQIMEEDLRRDLPEIFKPIDVDILLCMWATSCQTKVASMLNLTQGRVRHRFFKAVRALQDAADRTPKFVPYSKVFSALADHNFNMLKEVILPQWSDRGKDECF